MLTEKKVLSVIRKRDGEKFYIGVSFKKANLKSEDNIRFDLLPFKKGTKDYRITIDELYTDYIIEENVYLAIINRLVDRIDQLCSKE